MTRGDIANYLGLTAETISRLISRLKKAELIEVKGKYITIINFSELNKLAQSSTTLR